MRTKMKNNMRNRRPELLIPANNLEVLRVAVDYGADAVYIGGEAFSLRAKAKNFSKKDMAEGIAYAHAHGVRVHVTANILAHNEDLSQAAAYFDELAALSPDAVLVADPGMFLLAREHCPGVEIHLSTQANNTNLGTFRFWRDLGARRVVCARELSLEEIRQIREGLMEDEEKGAPHLEIESFIHGAMCISYSGRCLLSNYFTGRDANHGECTHPCRWKYYVMEESRPGEYLPVEENERGTYIFNSRDLCMIEYLPELAEAGIDSLKIEGRMKTALYVATVARTYRRAIDDYLTDEEIYRDHMEWYLDEIRKCTYRRFTTGFYFGKPSEESMVYDNNTYVNEAVYLGIAEECSGLRPLEEGTAAQEVCITQRNKFCKGDIIEIMKRDGRDIPAIVLSIRDEEGQEQESAPHPKQKLKVTLQVPEEGAAGEGELLRTSSTWHGREQK